MSYTPLNFLTRGNGHRVLISDIQLLQWYSQCRDIRRNPLPYSVVKDDAVVDLLAHRETPAIRSDVTQLFITPALTDDGTSSTNSFNPAVIQHAIPFFTTNPVPTRTPPRPRLPILPPTSIRRDGRPPPRLFSTNHLMSAPFPKLYSQSWTKKIPHPQYFQQKTTASLPTAMSYDCTPLTRCSSLNTLPAIRRRLKPQKLSVLLIKNSSSSRSRRKYTVSSWKPKPSNL